MGFNRKWILRGVLFAIILVFLVMIVVLNKAPGQDCLNIPYGTKEVCHEFNNCSMEQTPDEGIACIRDAAVEAEDVTVCELIYEYTEENFYAPFNSSLVLAFDVDVRLCKYRVKESNYLKNNKLMAEALLTGGKNYTKLLEGLAKCNAQLTYEPDYCFGYHHYDKGCYYTRLDECFIYPGIFRRDRFGLNDDEAEDLCLKIIHPGVSAVCLREGLGKVRCLDFAGSDAYLQAICNADHGDEIDFEPRTVDDFD